ncbi:MAG: hypothetical protein Q8P83_00015 [bacterium]|nr:hypothetical protein [bacterium]
MKKLIAGIGLMAMLLVVGASAQAGLIDQISDSSTGTISVTKLIKALIRNNNNSANINNTSVKSTANSGTNTVSSTDDQSGTQVNTGATDSVSGVDNAANTNAVAEDYETGCDCEDSVTNVSDDSHGTATSTDTLDNDIVNNNEVTVNNTVDSEGDSGTNSVSSGDSLTNTTVGTGASQSATGVLNTFNTNLKDIMRRVRVLP